MTSYKRIGAVSTTAQILRHLSNQKQPVSGKEIGLALDMPYGTVMCYLATLEDDGLVRNTDDCWELGMGMAVFWSKTREREEVRRDEAERNLKAIGAV